MSVKFEIADWRFELTLKELICQPIEDQKTGAKAPRRSETRTEKAESELLPVELLPQTYGRKQAASL